MKPNGYDTRDESAERAVLVGFHNKHERTDEAAAEASLEELVNLADTAGVQVVSRMTQSRDGADARTLIGSGKVQELKAVVSELGATTVIFDQELSGAQVRNLEAELDAKIIDRTQLILDIFAQRAKTREGILQVELAQLSYLLPRLSGHGKNLSRLGGGIGTRGPGETKLETDRRHIRRRISELKEQLAEVTRHRKLHRERRKKTGVFQVALVGYTNAGKSTLLNRLTEADVLAENKLFATLDPTSRQLKLPGGKEVILTDTVGFIQNLPHDLVAAFRATLEEVNEADLILHVVDSSSPVRDLHRKVVDQVLEELGAQDKERITVFNKVDLLPEAERELLVSEGRWLRVSAMRDEDLEAIKTAIEQQLGSEATVFLVPAVRGDLIAKLYRLGEVLEQQEQGEALRLTVRINPEVFAVNRAALEDYIWEETGNRV
ncbi:GTPase HflX [Paenibacillus thermoaerophilus]|uniref:GTPase HflX n=1 Tax=Paenibacillus thermoaerophilus TaxID=1215385 RepID=A0ABW2V6B5_9BACL|nr:GTPase HflX [Paenibacillus thermoaerophilus]TMV17119.1 GTPase HflX [Paenibacillus thermoaerophilus]